MARTFLSWFAISFLFWGVITLLIGYVIVAAAFLTSGAICFLVDRFAAKHPDPHADLSAEAPFE